MNIHEYQAKEVLRKYGVAVLNGKVACTPEEAEAASLLGKKLVTHQIGPERIGDPNVFFCPAARAARHGAVWTGGAGERRVAPQEFPGGEGLGTSGLRKEGGPCILCGYYRNPCTSTLA